MEQQSTSAIRRYVRWFVKPYNTDISKLGVQGFQALAVRGAIITAVLVTVRLLVR